RRLLRARAGFVGTRPALAGATVEQACRCVLKARFQSLPRGAQRDCVLPAQRLKRVWFWGTFSSLVTTRSKLRACLKNRLGIGGLRFGVPPLGGSDVVPPKGGTPNRILRHALRSLEAALSSLLPNPVKVGVRSQEDGSIKD